MDLNSAKKDTWQYKVFVQWLESDKKTEKR